MKSEEESETGGGEGVGGRRAGVGVDWKSK